MKNILFLSTKELISFIIFDDKMWQLALFSLPNKKIRIVYVVIGTDLRLNSFRTYTFAKIKFFM